MESLDMLANNLANSGAAGFKADREQYNTYKDEQSWGEYSNSVLPVVETKWTDFSQGPITATGSPANVALSGDGFIAVTGPKSPLYTRNGNLQIAADGTLQTQEGYALTGKDGKPIKIDSTKALEITPEGSVRQDGRDIAKLTLVRFDNPQKLAKVGNSYFQPTDAANTAKPALRIEVYQGRLEAANVSAPEAAVRLVNILRQFETMQKALTLAGEMNRRPVEEVAKVSG
jgi:flagellar basal-body rod protein FlgF